MNFLIIDCSIDCSNIQIFNNFKGSSISPGNGRETLALEQYAPAIAILTFFIQEITIIRWFLYQLKDDHQSIFTFIENDSFILLLKIFKALIHTLDGGNTTRKHKN